MEAQQAADACEGEPPLSVRRREPPLTAKHERRSHRPAGGVQLRGDERSRELVAVQSASRIAGLRGRETRFLQCATLLPVTAGSSGDERCIVELALVSDDVRVRARGRHEVVVADLLSDPCPRHPAQEKQLTRRWRRSCGESSGTPVAVQARASAVRSRSPVTQIFNNSGSSGGDVNSQAPRGATYMPPGRYKLQVNAIGSWVVKIVPGTERPQRIGSNIGFRGNGGRTLPPFRTRGGRTLHWRAGGGLFQLFSSGLNGPDVNSQASHGTTYMDGGTHQVTVNATKAWVIYWRP